MAKNDIIRVFLFGKEIGKVGYNEQKNTSYFQYHPNFLDSNLLTNCFPYIFKRIKPVQVFSNFEGETFRSLPPMIADSLPDMFGNIIFKEWIEAHKKSQTKISPLEQLTYVGNRGMGAVEYKPVSEIPKSSSIDISEMVEVLNSVLNLKKETSGKSLTDLELLNIFKTGTSAGGVRPKILISEHKKTGKIIPGDIEISDDYYHYLVKLSLNNDELKSYNREKIEYAYYLLALEAGINMMPSKLIDSNHFATLRFDRQSGEKQHVLTACGLTGWDFKKTDNSNYENLFKLASDLKVPYKDIQQLFKRMVFNIVFANTDDHLKNHSFMYIPKTNSWQLSPAYDLTYPLNINLNYTKVSRALSINQKRQDINLEDVLTIAEAYAINTPKDTIQHIQNLKNQWVKITEKIGVQDWVSAKIKKEFKTLL